MVTRIVTLHHDKRNILLFDNNHSVGICEQVFPIFYQKKTGNTRL